MIKASMAFIFSLLLLVSAGTVVAEMAKEGSGSSIIYYTVTSQVLAQGKGTVVVNYDARGVSGTDDETSPFYMASDQCVGSFRGIKGEFRELGLCTSTRLYEK